MLNWSLIGQLIRFGLVGGVATVVHMGGFAALIELAGMRPIYANVISFALATTVAFIGHNWWTFRQTSGAGRPVAAAGWRYITITLTGFAVSSGIVYAVTEMAEANYVYAIILILAIVPLGQFLMSKFWAFREKPA